MRWPFMLRATHDALMAAKQEAVELEAAHRVHAERRYDDLVTVHDTFVATLADRTLPPPKPVPPTPAPARPRDEADNAIDTAALFDPTRRRYLEKFVRERRQAGVDAGDIAQAILHPPETGYGEYEPE